MMLVEEGKLALDEPIVTYLPDLKLADAQARKTITLSHLLSHTSGLFGDYFDDFGMGDDALTRAIATFGTLRQQYAPGALWTYCNTGFGLAGAIVEKRNGAALRDGDARAHLQAAGSGALLLLRARGDCLSSCHWP